MQAAQSIGAVSEEEVRAFAVAKLLEMGITEPEELSERGWGVRRQAMADLLRSSPPPSAAAEDLDDIRMRIDKSVDDVDVPSGNIGAEE